MGGRRTPDPSSRQLCIGCCRTRRNPADDDNAAVVRASEDGHLHVLWIGCCRTPGLTQPLTAITPFALPARTATTGRSERQ